MSGEMEASEGQVLMVMWTGGMWRMLVLSLKNHESECYTDLSKSTLRNWIYLFMPQFFDKHNASCLWIIFKCCEIM